MTSSWLDLYSNPCLSFFLSFNSSVFKILVNTFPSSLSNKVAMYHGLHPLICLGGWICSCVRWVQERNWTFYHLGFCLLWRSLCLVSAMEAIFFFSTMNWVSLSAHGLSIVQAQDELFECRRGRQCIYYQ